LTTAPSGQKVLLRHWAPPSCVASRRAAARLLLTAGRAAIDQDLLAAGPTAANPLQRHAAAG